MLVGRNNLISLCAVFLPMYIQDTIYIILNIFMGSISGGKSNF